MEAGLMKIMLLNWKRELLKRFPEMEANCPPLQISNNIDIIFCDELSATNCPRRIVLRRNVREPFVLYAPWTGGPSLSLGLGQLWLSLVPFPLLALPFGIAFHLQLVRISYPPIFLLYLILKLVSFLGANRTKSSSVGPWLLRDTM